MRASLLGALLGCLVMTACFHQRPPGAIDLHAPLGLISASGHAVELDGFYGEPVLLHFWATWCASCVQEMESLQNVHEALAPRGLQIVSIAIDSDPVSVSRFRRSRGITFPVLIDTQGLAKAAYEVRGVPETFLIGRDGKLARIKDPVSGRPMPSIVGPRDWDDPLSVTYLREILDR